MVYSAGIREVEILCPLKVLDATTLFVWGVPKASYSVHTYTVFVSMPKMSLRTLLIPLAYERCRGDHSYGTVDWEAGLGSNSIGQDYRWAQ